MASTNYTITADSTPVYKDWPWSSAWDCAEWIKFRSALGTKYTNEEADYLWSKFWLDGVSVVGGGTGKAVGSGYITDSVPLSCRSFDENFKAFLDQNPNLKVAVFSGISGLIAKPISLVGTVIDGAGNIIGNTVQGASNASATLKWLIPTALIIAVVIAVIYFGKKAHIFNA